MYVLLAQYYSLFFLLAPSTLALSTQKTSAEWQVKAIIEFGNIKNDQNHNNSFTNTLITLYTNTIQMKWERSITQNAAADTLLIETSFDPRNVLRFYS